MKKESKILALLLVSLFLISFLSYFVSAKDSQAPSSSAAVKTVGEKIKSFFSNINPNTSGLSNDVKLGISKILLTILVILLVYSIIAFVPVIGDKPAIAGGVSIIVGILSFIFVKPEDIQGILVTYEALGVILTTVLPLIIIITFTIKLREKSPGMAVFVNKLIIAGFAVYVGVKWWTLPNNATLSWVYPITFIVSLIWLFLERWIYWKIFAAALSGNTEEFKQGTITLNEMKIRELQEKYDKAENETERRILQQKINQLKKANEKLGKIK